MTRTRTLTLTLTLTLCVLIQVHAYVHAPDGRTAYLSELATGSEVIAVDAAGRQRGVTVGRVKIETRPLVSLWSARTATARAPPMAASRALSQGAIPLRHLGFPS